jgi:hypothetical protein
MTLARNARTIVMTGMCALLVCGTGRHRRNDPIDRQAIERLHRLDVEATLTTAPMKSRGAGTGAPSDCKPAISPKSEKLRFTRTTSGGSTIRSGPASCRGSPTPRIVDSRGPRAFEWGYFTATDQGSTRETMNIRGEMVRSCFSVNFIDWRRSPHSGTFSGSHA